MISGSICAVSDIQYRIRVVINRRECIAFIPPQQQSVYVPMFAALLKGASSARIILESAQWCYIADTTTPEWRSIFLGLAFCVNWVLPHAATKLFIAQMTLAGGSSWWFLAGFACWAVYAIAAALFLQDDVPRAQHEHPALSCSELGKSFIDPIRLIFSNRVIPLLAIMYTSVAFALHILGFSTFAFARDKLGDSVEVSI